MSSNTILILMDQLISYHRLPKELLDILPGYQSFKKKGVRFDNIYNNRQMCSPSRASLTSSLINTGIQDNIDVSYQYNFVPYLSENVNTTGKIHKSNNYNTAYYGKQHYDSRIATDAFDIPEYCTNTRGVGKKYGFDIFNTFGDTYYLNQKGIFGDICALENINPPESTEFDYLDPITKNKLCGALPFLKARVDDKKLFYLEYHITNPHDTQHVWSNFSQIPSSAQSQFTVPFLDEQLKKYQVSDPYYYNDEFTKAFVKHNNLTYNYFEKNFKDYENKIDLLPFLKSFENDYPDDPTFNSINPFYIGVYYTLSMSFTNASDKNDLLSWKNLINNYYGLIIEADSYVLKIYEELEKGNLLINTNVVIVSDHGDCMSSHGLKQKGLPFNNATNICCLIYSPNLDKSLINTNSNYLGSLIDILPTLIDLSNLNKNNIDMSSILGKSLFIKNNNKLYINNLDQTVFQIVNNNMYLMSYYLYFYWYNEIATNEQKNNLSYNPDNIFDYKSYYVMIVKNIKGIKYKYGKYFSIYDILDYNILVNTEIKDIFSKEILIDYVNKSNNIEIFKKIIISEINKNFSDFFTFNQGLISLNGITKKYKIFIQYLYYSSIIDTLTNILQNIYKLPGVLNDFYYSKDVLELNLFCYNNTIDDAEIFNLLDKKNYDSYNDDIFNELNNELNREIINKNMLNAYLIIPTEIISVLGNIVLLEDNLPYNKTDELQNLKNLIYVNGLNNLDSSISQETFQGLANFYSDKYNLFINTIT